MVKLPPLSTFLAAPKKCFGPLMDAGSSPPDKVLPEGGITRLYALVKRVIPSSRMTTSLPSSTNALPSPGQCEHLYMVFRWQIESRGHNFCSRYRPNHICYFFGPFVYQKNDHMDFGMISSNCLSYFFRIVVFPAFGGATMSPFALYQWCKQVNHSVSYFLRPKYKLKRS